MTKRKLVFYNFPSGAQPDGLWSLEFHRLLADAKEICFQSRKKGIKWDLRLLQKRKELLLTRNTAFLISCHKPSH